MKKIIFLLFALTLGVGISTAFANGMQPLSSDLTIVVPQTADQVISQDVPVPVVCKAVSQEQVYLVSVGSETHKDVLTGSSGGIAVLCIISGETTLQPCQWTQKNDHMLTYFVKSDRTRCTQRKFSNTPVHAINCNFKFPLI